MAENHSPRQESCSEMQKSRANAKGKQDPFFMDKLNVIIFFFFKLVRLTLNSHFGLQDPGRSTGSLSRDFGLSRVVFSCLQSVTSSTPGHKVTKKTHSQTNSTQNAAQPSRFAEFQEVSRCLWEWKWHR